MIETPAAGMPYSVFAGNVGDDHALADVVRLLSHARSSQAVWR